MWHCHSRVSRPCTAVAVAPAVANTHENAIYFSSLSKTTQQSRSLSPVSHFTQVSSNAKYQTLVDVKFNEYQTQGINPFWNGLRNFLAYFQDEVAPQQCNVIRCDHHQSPVGEPCVKKFLTQSSPYFLEHLLHPMQVHNEA